MQGDNKPQPNARITEGTLLGILHGDSSLRRVSFDGKYSTYLLSPTHAFRAKKWAKGLLPARCSVAKPVEGGGGDLHYQPPRYQPSTIAVSSTKSCPSHQPWQPNHRQQSTIAFSNHQPSQQSPPSNITAVSTINNHRSLNNHSSLKHQPSQQSPPSTITAASTMNHRSLNHQPSQQSHDHPTITAVSTNHHIPNHCQLSPSPSTIAISTINHHSSLNYLPKSPTITAASTINLHSSVNYYPTITAVSNHHEASQSQ